MRLASIIQNSKIVILTACLTLVNMSICSMGICFCTL